MLFCRVSKLFYMFYDMFYSFYTLLCLIFDFSSNIL